MSNLSKGQIQLPGEFRPGEPIRADDMDKLRKAIAFVMKDMIGSGRGITVTQSAGKYLISARKQRGGASREKSRLQIVRTAPPSYDPATQGELTADDFFVSFGLYNGMVPDDIDAKITISAERHVYLEITVSSTNPGYASAVKISNAAMAPVNTEPAAGEWPTTVYVPLGKIEDVDGSWVITNYDNGNVGGAVFAGIFDVNTDGTVETSYSFIAARF